MVVPFAVLQTVVRSLASFRMRSLHRRMLYNKMVASSTTSLLPPFISVDGYGLCCDFTEECTREDIRNRDRSIRMCIHKYGQCTGGDQWFFHGG